MSVKTSVSSTAQSLSTRPGIFVRARSFSCIDPDEGSPHAVWWTASLPGSPGGGGVFCAVVNVLCLKRAKEGIQLVQQGDGAVTGLWWGLIVRNGLYPLPQAPSVSAVAETMGYPPEYCLLLSDAAG